METKTIKLKISKAWCPGCCEVRPVSVLGAGSDVIDDVYYEANDFICHKCRLLIATFYEKKE